MTATITGADQRTLIQRAESAAKAAASAAPESARLRRAADNAVAALESQRLTRMTLPATRGGDRAPIATQSEVLATLAEGDASISWITSVYNAVGYMVCAFGDQALDEFVTSTTPRSAGVFSVTGKATRVDGGHVVSGRWAFSSGQHHAGWILVPGIADDADGPLVWLVPRSEFTVEDDWHVTGLVATGSNAVSLNATFVPDHRSIPFASIVEGTGRESSFSDDPYYRQPFVPIMCALSAGTPVGLARMALRLFTNRIARRAITYTPYSHQSEAPVTHFQLAEAKAKLDQAEFHARRVATTVDQHIDGNLPWDVQTRVRCRADVAWAAKLAREACEVMEHGSGASAIHAKDAMPAILRDIRALSVHSFLLHSTNAELYGRILAGLDPAVPFI
jgi:alkylation response protein AidB-like acyl-CoA dehydrogenase